MAGTAQRQQEKENIYVWYWAWAHRKGSQGWRSWQLPLLNKQCRQMLAHISEPWVIPQGFLSHEPSQNRCLDQWHFVLFPAEQPSLVHLYLAGALQLDGIGAVIKHLCLREKNSSRSKSYLLRERKAQTYWMYHCKCWKLAPRASSLHSHLLTCETSSYSSPGFCTLNP